MISSRNSGCSLGSSWMYHGTDVPKKAAMVLAEMVALVGFGEGFVCVDE